MSVHSYSTTKYLYALDKYYRVVTGMRFTKEGRVIHMQIQEGVLGKGGVISSASWVPVVSYQITDRNVREDVDFHTLTWLDRAIDLDDLETDKMHEVLTGKHTKNINHKLNYMLKEYGLEC